MKYGITNYYWKSYVSNEEKYLPQRPIKTATHSFICGKEVHKVDL